MLLHVGLFSFSAPRSHSHPLEASRVTLTSVNLKTSLILILDFLKKSIQRIVHHSLIAIKLTSSGEGCWGWRSIGVGRLYLHSQQIADWSGSFQLTDIERCFEWCMRKFRFCTFEPYLLFCNIKCTPFLCIFLVIMALEIHHKQIQFQFWKILIKRLNSFFFMEKILRCYDMPDTSLIS